MNGVCSALFVLMCLCASILVGSPLGNTVESWSDQLIGNVPNVYIYAANNPSESIVAKRRGYGTIVSHNVPPYARAGLYKQLASVKELLAEYREDPSNNVKLQATIADSLVGRPGEPLVFLTFVTFY